MFDPQTASLIRTAPTLPALDRDRLPENLTKAFASIVAYRLELGSNPQAVSGERLSQLDEFRRLAATYECMVVVSPNRPERAAAAFVAAQAYHLLYLAKGLTAPVAIGIPTLSSEALSSELSALLLFLIADQTSDAIEMAKVIEANNVEMPLTLTLLTRSLVHFARGQMALINPLLEQLPPLDEEPIDNIAVNLLYRRLLEGLVQFATFVLNARQDFQLGGSAQNIFREVQALSILPLPSVVTIGNEESTRRPHPSLRGLTP